MQTKERYQLQRLTLLALLTAMCVVLRIFKIIDIPNVQPVTDIIMLTTLELGAGTGILLAILVMVISNIFLGFGIWTLPQIFAYAACALTVALFARLLPLKSRKLFWLQELLAGFLGLEYGFFVSLGMAGWGGWAAFIAYWVSGLTFDLYHAAGNLAFYPILYLPLVLGLDRFKKKAGWKQNA